VRKARFALIAGAAMALASVPPTAAEERMIDLPTGARLYVEIKGEGRPLLAIHGGLGLDHSYFEPWLDPLESGFQLIYPDLRGEGRSAGVADSEFTLDKMIDDLEALRIALGIKRWAVLGHSYGGFLAQAYALKYSDAVAGLVLADTSPAPRLISGEAARPWLAARMTPSIAAAFGEIAKLAAGSVPEGGDEQFKTLWHKVLQVYFDAAPPETLILADKTVYREHAFVLGARLTDGFDARPALARLTMPTLIVVGARDAILPLDHSEALAKAIPGARLEVFDRSGHFPFIEEPARFVAAIRSFLGP
jgi:proline iminopeptidase